eukprot:TRINITY_DN29000_c0_g1_i1.p1 TRINITY_DN29000_c0_g1~~TRINITY_DN29000_c0_g1_i1.p1  ORF type:complete len:1117 (-),score=194.17 TRINITY_DN29000_c0_g1_i1:107-2983(-)
MQGDGSSSVDGGGYNLRNEGGGQRAASNGADDMRRRRAERFQGAASVASSVSLPDKSKATAVDGNAVRKKSTAVAGSAHVPWAVPRPGFRYFINGKMVEAHDSASHQGDRKSDCTQKATESSVERSDAAARQAADRGVVSAPLPSSAPVVAQPVPSPLVTASGAATYSKGTSAAAAISATGQAAPRAAASDVVVAPTTPVASSSADPSSASVDLSAAAESVVASAEETSTAPAQVRFRFSAGGKEVLLEVRPDWTLQRLAKELEPLALARQGRPAGDAGQFEFCFIGRVLKVATPTTLSALGICKPGATVVVLERGLIKKGAPSPAPMQPPLPAGRPDLQTATARVWASVGVCWVPAQGGRVAEGALKCGWEADGSPLYMARCRHAGGLLVGKVGGRLGGCHVGFGGREQILPAYEVLCAAPGTQSGGGGRPIRFESARSGVQMPSGAVALGWEPNGSPLFGARISHGGGSHPGQADAALRTCRVGYGGHQVLVRNFEVLCFGGVADVATTPAQQTSQSSVGATSSATASGVVALPAKLSSDKSCEDGEVDSGSESGSKSDSDSGGSTSSSGSSNDGDDEVEALMASLGLPLPLPRFCRMNEAVDEVPKPISLPTVICEKLQGTVHAVKKISDGWHEGYEVRLRGADVGRVFCRIWRSQLSYFRLECATGSGVELRAMNIARASGLPAPDVHIGRDGKLVVGTVVRDGESCDFVVYNFVESASSERKVHKLLSSKGPSYCIDFGLMAKLHKHAVGPKENTEPLARFDDWREQLSYLETLAETAGCQAVQAAEAVRRCFEKAHIPGMEPALAHFDWHWGNVLWSRRCEVLAVLDWEFAGICDPRVDVARYVRINSFDDDCKRRKRTPEMKVLWQAYAEARFGSGAVAAECLGPLEPWLALESLAVFVTTAAVCARVAAGAESREPKSGKSYAPRCDLHEWFEDMMIASRHLTRLGLINM